MKFMLFMLFLILFWVSLFMAGFVSAEKPENPCAKDIETFCKDVEPGGGALARCLKENKEDLSAECKMKIAETREQLTETREACADDVEKFCNDVEGGRAVAKCLKENEKDISAGCKTKLEEFRKKIAH